jgi:hypothetical protein
MNADQPAVRSSVDAVLTLALTEGLRVRFGIAISAPPTPSTASCSCSASIFMPQGGVGALQGIKLKRAPEAMGKQAAAKP